MKQSALYKLTQDTKEQTRLQGKLNELTEQWSNAGDTSLSRTMQSILPKCSFSRRYMAVILDMSDYIEENSGQDDFELRSLLNLSFACGSQNSAKILMNKLDSKYESFTTDQLESMLTLIATSGNTQWLQETLTQLDFKRVPSYCFTNAPAQCTDELKTLHVALSKSEATENDNHPKSLNPPS